MDLQKKKPSDDKAENYKFISLIRIILLLEAKIHFVKFWFPFLICIGIISNKDSTEQHESLHAVCAFYKVDPEEWRCLAKYLSRHQDDSPETFAKTLLTTDVGDSYPTMAHLAAVTLACPLRTAGERRSKILKSFRHLWYNGMVL